MEKLVLPFDFETWTGLGVIFFLAAVAVFVINRLPQKYKKLFYGKSKSTTIFKIIETFVGIPHKESPEGNFPRIVLISFIFWCLVMRTAYQGKFFEFITTTVRKAEIETLEELKAKNYTLYLPYSMNRDELFDYLMRIIG